MKRHITAIALAGALAAAVLTAGCGNTDTEKKDSQKRTEGQAEAAVKKEDKKEEKVLNPKKKAEDFQDKGKAESSSREEADRESGSGSSGQQKENAQTEGTDRGEVPGYEEKTDREDVSEDEGKTGSGVDSDGGTEEPAVEQTVTGTIQEIGGSTLGIMEADGGVYGFDIGILSGFDDSYQIGDTVTVTYVGDTMDPDSAEISH